jgi:uncharacterized protein YfaT (DUF1175 family)
MSEVSDLSEVVNDGVLSESYFILRQTGHFGLGGWIIDSSSNLNGWGVVSVATEEDLLMITEGDRVTGIMVFHSEKRIYETQLDTAPTNSSSLQKFSDIMIWNHQQWRVLAVGPYPNRKFWRALAVRMAGV